MDVRNLGERLEAAEAIDLLAQPLRRVVSTALPRGDFKDALHGVWLGHPLHPLLTDLPIGFWTSAWVLDMVGGRKARPAADMLVGLGVASALPTAATGLADWSELFRSERRTGAVHALTNIGATALYGLSFLARRRGHRLRGVALAMAGAGAATVGGFLGGHLSFRRAVGVNHAASASSTAEWTEVGGALPEADGQLTLADIEGTPVVAARTEGGTVALADRCSHLGGPLHEGELLDGCVRCPWHGSTFRLRDGSVAGGPATATQPAYELRTTEGRTEGRRKRPK